MTEPIEKITDETVVGEVDPVVCWKCQQCNISKVQFDDLNLEVRTMLLTSAEKDAKIKELEEKLKEALETLEELKWCYHNADSGKRWVEAVRDCVDLVEKLKAE